MHAHLSYTTLCGPREVSSGAARVVRGLSALCLFHVVYDEAVNTPHAHPQQTLSVLLQDVIVTVRELAIIAQCAGPPEG